jgi:hypothetical protein
MPGAIRIDFWNRITAFYASARLAEDVLDGLRVSRDDGEQHPR